jgi:hypothetical protein
MFKSELGEGGVPKHGHVRALNGCRVHLIEWQLSLSLSLSLLIEEAIVLGLCGKKKLLF